MLPSYRSFHHGSDPFRARCREGESRPSPPQLAASPSLSSCPRAAGSRPPPLATPPAPRLLARDGLPSTIGPRSRCRPLRQSGAGIPFFAHLPAPRTSSDAPLSAYPTPAPTHQTRAHAIRHETKHDGKQNRPLADPSLSPPSRHRRVATMIASAMVCRPCRAGALAWKTPTRPYSTY